MAYSAAQKKATAKYMKNNLDEIKIRVPKGKKEIYKRQAAQKGYSLNAYIIKLLDADGEK